MGPYQLRSIILEQIRHTSQPGTNRSDGDSPERLAYIPCNLIKGSSHKVQDMCTTVLVERPFFTDSLSRSEQLRVEDAVSGLKSQSFPGF